MGSMILASSSNVQQNSMLQQVTKSVTSTITAANRMLVTSVTIDDAKILKQIQATDAHETHQLDVNPILDLIEDIFQHAQTSTLTDLVTSGAEDLAGLLEVKMGGGAAAGPQGAVLDALTSSIQKVCCEFTCKCTAGDAHASAMAVLGLLGNYPWDAKVVIALAAFAVTYGELWLVMLLSKTNPLARSIAVLKQTPDISDIKGVLKPRLEPINEMTKIMVDVAKSLIEFRLLPSKYISPEDPPLASSVNEIAMATYWTIRSIVASGAQIAANFGLGVTTSVTEAWDLSSLAHKVKSLHDHLVQRLHLCHEYIEKKREEEEFRILVDIFNNTYKDNLRILKAFIYAKDDIQPLVEISTKVRVNVDVLRSKTVLFLISDLDVPEEELIVLDKLYRESRISKTELQYEIVWLPVVDRTATWTSEHERRFEDLKCKMCWYTLCDPLLLNVASIRYIKEVWGFAQKPMIVSLDPVGRVVSQNAYNMMLIWGNLAYPFTAAKEQELWSQQTWRLDFLLGAIHPEFPKWIAQEETHICVFGGENIEWIRKFTLSMKEHAVKIGVKLELVYVGKHNAKEAAKKIIEVINSERLAHTLPDLTQVWYFWTRIESMMYSKIQYGKNVDNDVIVKEVMSLLSFDGGDQVWGLIGRGSDNMIVKAKGDVILNSMTVLRDSGAKVSQMGFLAALAEAVESISDPHHCNRIVLPAIEGAGVPGVVLCADCQRPMGKFIMYQCCTGY